MALPRKRKKLEDSSQEVTSLENKEEATTASETAKKVSTSPSLTPKRTRRAARSKSVVTDAAPAKGHAKLDQEFDLVEKLGEEIPASEGMMMLSEQNLARSAGEFIRGTTLPEDNQRTVLAASIIQKHVMLASGAALIPAPFVDIVFATGVQVRLIGQLAELYEKDFSIARAKYLIAALSGNYAVGISSLWGGLSLAKAVPGLGTVVGTATMPVVMGASTYAVGRVFSHHFSLDGELTNFKPAKNRKYFQEQLEAGKQIAAGLNNG
ncbi:MAG: DUF697 domain-containing protein [SAR324 cluster bacterium]|nr:DUF697 domain-containing protein [SAR324 cluster bacterium]